MREILFRGKRIDNGEWVYGFLYETEKSSSCNAESYILEKERLTINYKCVEGITTHIPFVQVTPDTVGQFTGLTDKNGKRIFEGDIIVDHDFLDTKYVVCFNEAAFVAKEITTNEVCWLRDFIAFEKIESEVIGNIHDNPELLEDKP